MNYLHLFLFLILVAERNFKPTRTSKMHNHELKEYSYLVNGDINLGNAIGHAQGTGFFIERNGKVFFVTSKHTLSGCNDQNMKDERYPNQMNINLNNDSITINTSPIKDSAKCLPIVVDPDIIAHPLTDVEQKKEGINIINEFEGEKPENSNELVIWGFPNNSTKIESFVSQDFISLTSLDVTLDGQNYFKDEIHYCITVNDKKINEEMVGFSGSPVFLKNMTSGKFILIGVLCGTNIPANGMYIVQPKYLHNLID